MLAKSASLSFEQAATTPRLKKNSYKQYEQRGYMQFSAEGIWKLYNVEAHREKPRILLA